VLREHIEQNNHSIYGSQAINGEPVSRTYCMPSGSLVEIIPSLRAGNSITSRRLIILSLPVFSELNVEIFNENRLFIDRLSWLRNTMSILFEIMNEIVLIIRLHPNASSYGEEAWIKKHLDEFTKGWNDSIHITANNLELGRLVNHYSAFLGKTDFIIYQGSLSIELPQFGIRPICGVSPLGPKEMTLSSGCIDEYKRMILSPDSFTKTISREISQSASRAVSFDNSLARGSEAEPYMQELDKIYHFGKVSRSSCEAPKVFRDFTNQIDWHSIHTGNFTSYMLRLR